MPSDEGSAVPSRRSSQDRDRSSRGDASLVGATVVGGTDTSVVGTDHRRGALTLRSSQGSDTIGGRDCGSFGADAIAALRMTRAGRVGARQFSRQIAWLSAAAKPTQARYGTSRIAAPRLDAPEGHDRAQDRDPQRHDARERQVEATLREEEPGPGGVQRQLQQEEERPEAGATLPPGHPPRHRHERVQQRPDRAEDPAGRRPRRLPERGVPLGEARTRWPGPRARTPRSTTPRRR